VVVPVLSWRVCLPAGVFRQIANVREFQDGRDHARNVRGFGEHDHTGGGALVIVDWEPGDHWAVAERDGEWHRRHDRSVAFGEFIHPPGDTCFAGAPERQKRAICRAQQQWICPSKRAAECAAAECAYAAK